MHEIESGDLTKELLAHEQEVVCLDYSPFADEDGFLLASGSRDRLIHVFSCAESIEPMGHLDDHTSSLVAVKFAFDSRQKGDGRLKIISAGADKAIIYRSVTRSGIDLYHKEGFKTQKVVSMTTEGSKVVAGHDKLLTATDAHSKSRVFEKKPEKIKL